MQLVWLALAAATLPASAGPIAKLVTNGGKVSIQIGGRSAVIYPMQDSRGAVSLGSVDADKTLHQWLEDDDRWGGHKAANDLRYMDWQGGGILGIFTDVAKTKVGTTFAVMSLKFMGPSGEPTASQILVRKGPNANSVVWVRQFSDWPSIPYASSPKRLFVYRGVVYVLENGGLFELQPDGSNGKRHLAVAREAVAQAVANKRYILMESESRGENGWMLEAIDLESMRVFLICKAPPGSGAFPVPYFDRTSTGDSPYVQVVFQLNDNGDRRTTAVHLPDLKSCTIPNSLTPLGEFGFEVTGGKVMVYRLKTGMRVQSLLLPPGIAGKF